MLRDLSVAGAALALAAGCGGGLEPPQPFAACAAPVAPLTDPYVGYRGWSASLSGPVLDAGRGDPPADCFDLALMASTVALDRDEAAWLRAEDPTGAGWVVGWWLPDGPDAPEIGVEVQVDLSWAPGMFGPSIGRVSVTDPAGLLAWVAIGGTLDDLADPPLPLARGEVVARDHDDCGAWASYALLAGGVVVPYGGVEEVAGFEVRHGGLDEATRYDGCPDWFVAHAAVAVTGAP